MSEGDLPASQGQRPQSEPTLAAPQPPELRGNPSLSVLAAEQTDTLRQRRPEGDGSQRLALIRDVSLFLTYQILSFVS